MPELSAMGGRTSGVRTIRWQVGPQSLVISYLRARRAEAVSWPRRRWKHARGRSGVLAAEAVETHKAKAVSYVMSISCGWIRDCQ